MRVHRRGKGRREPLSGAVHFHLLTGQYPARGQFDTWADVWMLSPHQKRDAWLEHRADLLAEWCADHPGERPWIFWLVEAEEPRRVLEGAELLMPVRPGSTDWEWAWRADFGVPAFQQCRPRGFVGSPLVESQAVYLDRLKLLTDAERAALPPDADEPEEIDPFLVDEDDDDHPEQED